VGMLRHALEYDPFPFAPRLDPLKAILAKLELPRRVLAASGPRGHPPRDELTPSLSGTSLTSHCSKS